MRQIFQATGLLLSIVFTLFSASQSMALNTEFGVSYARKKTTFNQDNFTDTESTSASVSLYFMEKIALELSYTDATGVRQEQVLGNKQITYQKTNVLGADLIFILMDRTSMIQPYVKGGVAQITRRQEIKVATLDPIIVEPEVAIVPSYGAGLKFNVTPTFGIKLSYDVWRTPVGDGSSTDDANFRAGVTWML